MPFRKSPARASTGGQHSGADLDTPLWPDEADASDLAEAPDPADQPGAAETNDPPRPTDKRPLPTGSAPRMPARDRIRIQRERDATKRRRVRMSVAAAGVVVLGGVIAGVTALPGGHTAARPRPTSAGYTGPYAPVTLNADNSVTMAWPAVAKPVLDVYEDFSCSACRTFEQTDGVLIQQLADQRKLKVVYWLFTSDPSQAQLASSMRAWAAARCAPPGNWASYHNMLFANQPPQSAATGFSVPQLIQLGKDASITSPAFAQCVRTQQYAMLDEPVSDQIINGGLATMPALVLNGKPLGNDLTATALRKLILAAATPTQPAKRTPTGSHSSPAPHKS